MATAKQLLELATTQIGTKESPPGSNNVTYNTSYYGRDVNGNAYPWCCAFQWWLFRELRASRLFYDGNKTASCTTLYNYYKNKDQAVPVSDAKPGDLVFFIFDGNKKGILNHIGICESAGGGYITTIDGNTSESNDANGGCVMRRRRAIKYVGGVACPNYEEDIDMTREEIEVMVSKAVSTALAERDNVQSEIAQKVSQWAAVSWDKAVKAGVFDGTRPGGMMTREQTAVVLDRLGLLKDGGL